ncbi:MAG: PaaI family thioesterase [Beijerinckiaceae bacterium]|nr:PaaI family thioesterase [Beijerinckiaceae bacterium]
MTFEPRDPDYEARIKGSFARQGFMAHLGARIGALGPGLCVITADFRPEVSQQHGFFHGGVIGALADNAGAYAAFTLIEAHQSMLSVEYKINLLAPGHGDRLRAVGKVIRPGRTLTVSAVDIFVEKDGAETLCATALVTLMTLANRGDT